VQRITLLGLTLDGAQRYAPGVIKFTESVKVTTHQDQTETTRRLREDLTAEEREKAERIGSIEFKSAGASRKR
jgi:hypothetical protein